MDDKSHAWENHYTKDKSVLSYPDENLVRMISPYLKEKKGNDLIALDLGCGTGRHIKMMADLGIKYVIGLDYSLNALNICKDLYSPPLILADNNHIPLKDDSIDIAVSWGSLHYCRKDSLERMIKEIYRIMKSGGVFYGTLRSSWDTHMKKGEHIGNDMWITNLDDIKNSVVSFYNHNELQKIFSIFSKFEFGLMERSIIGNLSKVISHWFFRAEKQLGN